MKESVRTGRRRSRTQLSFNIDILYKVVTWESSSAVERSLSMREARGSTPRSSTTFYFREYKLSLFSSTAVSEGVLSSSSFYKVRLIQSSSGLRRTRL